MRSRPRVAARLRDSTYAVRSGRCACGPTRSRRSLCGRSRGLVGAVGRFGPLCRCSSAQLMVAWHWPRARFTAGPACDSRRNMPSVDSDCRRSGARRDVSTACSCVFGRRAGRDISSADVFSACSCGQRCGDRSNRSWGVLIKRSDLQEIVCLKRWPHDQGLRPDFCCGHRKVRQCVACADLNALLPTGSVPVWRRLTAAEGAHR